MKKNILISIIVVISIMLLINALYPFVSYCISTIGEKGSIVGEVYATYHDSTFYIKALDNPENKLILEILIDPDTVFASGPLKENINEMPELKIGSIVEVDYIYRPNLGATYATSIKTTTANAQSEWPEIILNENYSKSDSEIGHPEYGEIVHIVNTNDIVDGWIVYIKNDYGRIIGYFFDRNNKLIPDELKNLLDQKAMGYRIKVYTRYGSDPIKNHGISGAFSVELP